MAHTGDFKNYIIYIKINLLIKNGFIDGNKYTPNQLNVKKFDATIMSLTERNVPDNWNGDKPNAMRYKQPSNPVKYVSICPYKDNVYNKS